MSLGLNSINGLISGLDTSALVDNLITFERRPAFLLEARKAHDELQLAAYDALESALAGLKSQLDGMRRPADYQLRQAQVSDETLLSVKVESAAAQGHYALRIQQLAQSHQVLSQGYADEETSLGTGSVKISLAGEEILSVNLSDGASSLRELANAINAANAGVSASIVNTGAGETPYQLILTGAATGADQLITIESDLSGGEGLAVGSVGAVEFADPPPEAGVTSGGLYTGATDASYSFSVTTGGEVGEGEILIAWSNDQGDSGTIALDASYTPGDAVQVHAGLALSFGAGQLQTDSAWTVAAGTGTIQAAQDAVVRMGSGGTPLEIHNSSNSITGLIPGVTFDLLGADPAQDVSVQVEQDTGGLINMLQGFVDQYNAVIDYFNTQMDYNETSQAAGLLLGDQVALRLDSQMRQDLTRGVLGLSTEYTQLSQIGIGTSVAGSLSTDGTLAIDEARLRAALTEDLGSVIALLGSTGEVLDEDLVFLNAGSDARPTDAGEGYEVRITQAAKRGRYEGLLITEPSAFAPLTIDATNRNLKLTVNGVTSGTLALAEGEVASGAELASLIQAAVNADETLGSREVLVNWVSDGSNGHLEIVSKTYGAGSEVVLEDVDASIYADAGLDGGIAEAGQDVAGYFLVDGEREEASGSGRVLTGSQDGAATKSLSIQVNLTEDMLIAQGEDQGRVKVASGVVDRLHRSLSGYLDGVKGILALREGGLRETIRDFEGQIDAIDQRLEIRRDRYLREFMRMEELLSQMNSTNSAFLNLVSSLPNINAASEA